MTSALDAYVAKNTGFNDFQDLLDAKGDYRPSIDVSDPARKYLADAYDKAQEERGDPRRAFRYGVDIDFLVRPDGGGYLFRSRTNAAKDLIVKYLPLAADPILDARGAEKFKEIIEKAGLTYREWGK